jgi:hypothetical protein
LFFWFAFGEINFLIFYPGYKSSHTVKPSVDIHPFAPIFFFSGWFVLQRPHNLIQLLAATVAGVFGGGNLRALISLWPEAAHPHDARENNLKHGAKPISSPRIEGHGQFT